MAVKYIASLNSQEQLSLSQDEKLIQAGIQFGKTMVFMRRHSFDYLEREKVGAMNRCAVCIQTYRRMYRRMVLFKKMRKAAIKCQNRWRIWLAQSVLLKLIQLRAIKLLLRISRGFIARKRVSKGRWCLIRLQARFRGISASRFVRNLRRNMKATLIGTCFRR